MVALPAVMAYPHAAAKATMVALLAVMARSHAAAKAVMVVRCYLTKSTLLQAAPVRSAVRHYETVCSHVVAALMVAHYYLMSSTLSLEDDRDDQSAPALPIRAH
jgi:hypothetical protein